MWVDVSDQPGVPASAFLSSGFYIITIFMSLAPFVKLFFFRSLPWTVEKVLLFGFELGVFRAFCLEISVLYIMLILN